MTVILFDDCEIGWVGFFMRREFYDEICNFWDYFMDMWQIFINFVVCAP